jgi:hypothetical protein
MAWWLSEALSWLSNPRKVYDPLRIQKPTLGTVYDIQLYTPVTEKEYNVQGNVLQVLDWTGEDTLAGMQIRLNEPDAPAITFTEGTTIFSPIYRFFLTIPSGGRGTCRIYVGRGSMTTAGVGISLGGQNFLASAYFTRFSAMQLTISAGNANAILLPVPAWMTYIRKIVITNPTADDLYITDGAGTNQYPFPAYKEMVLDFPAAWKTDLATTTTYNKIYVGNPTASTVVVPYLIFWSIPGDFR